MCCSFKHLYHFLTKFHNSDQNSQFWPNLIILVYSFTHSVNISHINKYFNLSSWMLVYAVLSAFRAPGKFLCGKLGPWKLGQRQIGTGLARIGRIWRICKDWRVLARLDGLTRIGRIGMIGRIGRIGRIGGIGKDWKNWQDWQGLVGLAGLVGFARLVGLVGHP